MRTIPRCNRCGDQILFLPARLGNGIAKMYPHNFDDRQLHFRRCRLTLDLRAARKAKKEGVDG